MLKNILYDGIFGYLLSGVENNQVLFITLFVVGILLCIVLPYLVGSLNWAILISKLFYHDDIRNYGSGNAGSTNMLRTYGKKVALLTFAGDFAKGILGVLIGRIIFGVLIGAYIGGLFAVLGHIFPCYYKFKGGKGVATTAGMILMTNWKVLLVLAAFFVLLVYMTKYISFGSTMCFLLYPLLLSKMRLPTDPSMGILIAIVIMGLGVFMHRGNLKRIFQGTENKLSFKVKDKKPENTKTDENDGESDV